MHEVRPNGDIHIGILFLVNFIVRGPLPLVLVLMSASSCSSGSSTAGSYLAGPRVPTIPPECKIGTTS
jgi:hypothetical protein